MKKLMSIILVMVLTLTCFAGCSKNKNNGDNSLDNERENTSQLTENEFSDDLDSAGVSLNEGEFDPLSIVKDEYISYDKYGYYYNGGGTAVISFPADFEIEIIPGLYLKATGSGKNNHNLRVIYNNQSLGILEYRFVGETLRYNDINKLSEGDILELVVSEHDDSDGLDDNLAANGFTMVKIPMYITVPDLGELFTAEDTLSKTDIEYIVSMADPSINDTAFVNFTYSEKPISIYKGVIKSKTTVGEAVRLKLIYERTSDSGYKILFALTTCNLAKHDDNPVTCTFKIEEAYGYKVDIAEADMIAEWSEDYTWEKLDY